MGGETITRKFSADILKQTSGRIVLPNTTPAMILFAILLVLFYFFLGSTINYLCPDYLEEECPSIPKMILESILMLVILFGIFFWTLYTASQLFNGNCRICDLSCWIIYIILVGFIGVFLITQTKLILNVRYLSEKLWCNSERTRRQQQHEQEQMLLLQKQREEMIKQQEQQQQQSQQAPQCAQQQSQSSFPPSAQQWMSSQQQQMPPSRNSSSISNLRETSLSDIFAKQFDSPLAMI